MLANYNANAMSNEVGLCCSILISHVCCRKVYPCCWLLKSPACCRMHAQCECTSVSNIFEWAWYVDSYIQLLFARLWNVVND